jgi:hydrophobe/amphiphile efflux-3 (HAE3) family protein
LVGFPNTKIRGIKIRKHFEKLGFFIENNTLPLIILALLFVVISIQGMQYIEMAQGTETFVEKTSKLYQDYDHLYLSIFSTQSIIVIIEGGDVTTPELMQALDRLEHHTTIIPGVVETFCASSVIKDINFQQTGQYAIPDNEQDIDAIISSHASDLGMVLPDDTHTLVWVEMEGDSTEIQREEILRETEVAVSLADIPPDYTIIVTGDPVFDLAMDYEMNASMGPLLMISALMMIIVLYLVFRHVRWKLLPLPIVLLGIIYTFGAMGYLKIPLSMVSMSAFPILIGLGIDYAIQFHNRIEEELERKDNEKEAVIETVKHTGPAVLIALIITGLGFFSLMTSSVPMIQDFGKLLLIGIIMCFLSALFIGITVIYGLDTLLKKYSNKNNNSTHIKKSSSNTTTTVKSSKIEQGLEKASTFSMKYPAIVLSIAGLLCISGLYVDTMVPIQTDVTTFVPPDMQALIDLQHLGSITGGTDALNLIIKVEDSASPEILQWIDEFSEHEVKGRSNIYDAASIVPIIKSMNGGVIPDNSADIKRLYDQMPQAQKDRYVHGENMLLLNLGIGNAIGDIGLKGVEELVGIVSDDISWMPPPPGAHVTITGNSVVFTMVISALTTGRVAMTLFGLVLVFFGLLVLYRDFIKAIAPVATMFMVIGWSGGIMYYTGLEYTPMTVTLGALILGVGSEYAILMMERYYEEKGKGINSFDAMRLASKKIGKAIVASGLTTLFGFSSLLASPFSMTRNFGIVTLMDVALALLATFVVFPAIIIILDNWRDKKNTDVNIQ